MEAHNYTIIFLYLLKSFDLKFKNNAVYFVNLLFSPIIFNVLNTYKYIVNRCEIFYSCPAVIFKWWVIWDDICTGRIFLQENNKQIAVQI